MKRERCPHCRQMYTPQEELPASPQRERGREFAAVKKAEDPDYFRKLGASGGRPRHQRFEPKGEGPRRRAGGARESGPGGSR